MSLFPPDAIVVTLAIMIILVMTSISIVIILTALWFKR